MSRDVPDDPEAPMSREALVASLDASGTIRDPRLEEAMLSVPRDVFVPPQLEAAAYEDRPLPVGFGQTISAPHMVAMMTGALQLEAGMRVLEIGTGGGYHAAVLHEMVKPGGKVVTLELISSFVELARDRFEQLGMDVEVHRADGAHGWPEEAPYDAILVTCAVPEIPFALLDQLKIGGHIVAPVGVTRCDLRVGRRVREGPDGVEFEGLGECIFVNAQWDLGRTTQT